MARRAFRFIHSSDWRLDTPIHGGGVMPSHLRTLCVEAPYRAAERVIDHAIADEAAFVLLAGNILDRHATGPHGPLFLVSQFERLAERGIAVYWAEGKEDTLSDWPRWAPLPANVRCFASDTIQEVLHAGKDFVAARILATGQNERRALRASTFQPSDHDACAIALAHGRFDRDAISTNGRINYWALGGKFAASVNEIDNRLVCYSGAPQGLTPREEGAHGCLSVHVDDEGGLRARRVSCDVARWVEAKIVLDADPTREEVDGAIHERLQHMTAENPRAALFVNWKVVAPPHVRRRLRMDSWTTDFLAELRRKYGFEEHPVWSASLAIERPAPRPGEYGTDSLLDDFLLSAEAMAEEDGAYDLSEYLGSRPDTGILTSAIAINDSRTRRRVAQQVASLGMELLGEESPT